MIYVTGDTHGDFTRFDPAIFPEQAEMTKDDYVIICGDFGGVWNTDPHNSKENESLDWLESCPFTTLFVDGNHENFDLLNSYPVTEWNGGTVHVIRKNIIHLMRGQVFDIVHHIGFHRIEGLCEIGYFFKFAYGAELFALGVFLCEALPRRGLGRQATRCRPLHLRAGDGGRTRRRWHQHRHLRQPPSPRRLSRDALLRRAHSRMRSCKRGRGRTLHADPRHRLADLKD